MAMATELIEQICEYLALYKGSCGDSLLYMLNEMLGTVEKLD